eukprot:gene2642-3839_t
MFEEIETTKDSINQLKINRIFNIELKECKQPFWKMNLTTSFENNFYICSENEILYYKLKYNVLEFQKKEKLESSIHQIKFITFLNERVLYIVGDNGMVLIINSNNLNTILKINNSNESTWSLAFKNNLFIFGDNSHNIKVYKYLTKEYFILKGHSNNVPCVDLSNCGKYLLSTSIDKTIRIWNVKEKKEIVNKKVNHEWGWSCKWIKINTIQNGFEHKLKHYNDYINEENEFLEEDDDEEYENDLEKKDEIISNKEEMKNIELNEYNILYGTKSMIYLLNSKLEIIDSIYFNPSFDTILPFWMQNGLSRVLFLEYIPELSCAIIGSSSCSKLLLLKVNKDKLIPMSWIPDIYIIEELFTDEQELYPISGFSISKDEKRKLQNFRLYISFMSGRVCLYEIQNTLNDQFDISKII